MIEKLGYIKNDNVFVKEIGIYTITLFPAGEGYIRRITKSGGDLVDMQKVKSNETELGDIMEQIIVRSTYTTPVLFEEKNPYQGYTRLYGNKIKELHRNKTSQRGLPEMTPRQVSTGTEVKRGV